ncbi:MULTISPECIES: DcaP family trimeric outer membrane transporter [unclassified Ruegeria]|uniref:DcaP family trimeric outer membrane transporter n=1 Tax=unclassified Ruegeria TaxID=2625375 RepID=UPI001AE1A02A|nr:MULTISPECIES: DcaP family trimeric outer membrane transporter [unclassified Ruegeria]
MTMTRKKALLLAASALSVTGTFAVAQDAQTQAELDALRARVEALEADKSGPANGDFRIGNTVLDVYGYVKADFFYDFDYDQGDTAFVNVIGEPSAATDGTFGATVRQSRIGLRTTTPSGIGDIGGQLELDLFGSGGTAELRIRHANITIGDQFLIGQYWTNFQPLDTYPTTVEFNGPVGIAFARVPQLRYTGQLGSNAQFAVSIEENVSGSNSDDPVLTASAEYNDGTYIARGAVLYGKANSGNVEVDQTGFTLSGGIRPWQGGLFQVNYVTGEALGPYLIGLGDAIVGGQANDVDGYTVEFRQDLGAKWNVGIAYGREDYDLPTSTGTLSFTELETIHVNAFYKATDSLTLSAEYIYGERNDAPTGRTFDGSRVQLAAQLNF